MRNIAHRRVNRASLMLAFAALAACGSDDNVIGPDNQLQVANATDDFQFQVSNLDNVSQTLNYYWTNTGDSANINQSSSVTGGSSSLTIRGPTTTVLYKGPLGNSGTFHTLKSTPGTWQIEVYLYKMNATLSFRVQKAP